MSEQTYQPRASHYVDGGYCEDKQGALMSVLYPATGEEIARVHEATDAVMERAVAGAHRAQGDWGNREAVERGRILLEAARLLRLRNREFSVLETMDTGKPLQETLVADAATAADAFEYFGALALSKSFEGRHVSLGGGSFAYTTREPFGVCLALGAWNYPIQTGSWKIAPALALGNSVVFKPSELTPLSALALGELLTEAGLPDGVLQVVQGAGEVGAKLLSDVRIRKVSLTGSVETGRRVAEMAGAGLKKITLELGGKSPLIVCGDADLDEAVSGALLANFYSTGQVCSNATRVFVERSIKKDFLERLCSRVEGIRIGDPMDEETSMGPMITSQQRNIVKSYIEGGKREGARLVMGGDIPKLGGVLDGGFFIEPVIFDGVGDGMAIAREEIFGPVLCVMEYEDEDDVIERSNATELGLSAGVFSCDLERAHRIASRFLAGTCWINSYNATVPGVPFGGCKFSGLGSENSLESLDSYSWIKSVYVGGGKIDAPY